MELEGYETWTQHINVQFNEHKQVNAVLTPLQTNPQELVTVTKTVSTTITTTITSTTTITTQVTTATTTTITSKVTDYTGLPTELAYGAIGIAVIAVLASIVIATRKKQ